MTNLTTADLVTQAANTGKEAKFEYNGELYEFSPQGIAAYLSAIGFGSGGAASDQIPDAFSFTPITGAQLSIDINSSEVITITGINTVANVTSDVPYSKNGGSTQQAGATTAINGDTFQLFVRSSDFALTPTTGTLTVGGISGTFTVTTGDFLTPLSMLGQQIDKAFFQEDCAEGEVTNWISRGRRITTATQATQANRPTKLPSNGGVLFGAGVKKWLQWTTDYDAPWSHRWWIAIARADLSGFTAPYVCSINAPASGSNQNRQPSLRFDRSSGNPKFNQSVWDNASRTLQPDCSPTFATWNVLIGWRRGFKHFVRVNGASTLSSDFLGWRQNSLSSICTIGDNLAIMPADCAIDCIIFGDGELTDYQIEVLEGWAHWRVSRQSALTLGIDGSTSHLFASAAPTNSDFDSTDLHNVFEFDVTEYGDWSTEVDSSRFAHRGEDTYSATGYTTVFFTDFDLADQLPAADLTGEKNSPWFAPGWLDTLDDEATMRQSNGTPSPLSYIQDTSATAGGVGRPGTLALRMRNNGTNWVSGAMYTVNYGGIGRAWGKGIFEVRLAYTSGAGTLSSPYPGFFPAPLWSYFREHLYHRTRNRVEPDFTEQTGKNSKYSETNIHIHAPSIVYPNDDTVSLATDVAKKPYGYSFETATDADFSGTLNIYDGNFHKYTCKIDDDFIYWWIDDEEMCRTPTATFYTGLKYLIANFALDAAHGDRTPDPSETFDMVFDYIKVMQKSTDLTVIPTGFSGLPTIAGTTTSGSTLTVTPNTTGTQIEYRWYRDGVPIVTPIGTTYQLVAADVGHKIRVHVKNKSLVNQPEAWTAETATIT